MKQLPADPPPAPRLAGARQARRGPVVLDWQPGAKKAGELGALPGRRRGRDAGRHRPGGAKSDPRPAPGTYCLSGLDRSGNEGPLSGRALHRSAR